VMFFVLLLIYGFFKMVYVLGREIGLFDFEWHGRVWRESRWYERIRILGILTGASLVLVFVLFLVPVKILIGAAVLIFLLLLCIYYELFLGEGGILVSN